MEIITDKDYDHQPDKWMERFTADVLDAVRLYGVDNILNISEDRVQVYSNAMLKEKLYTHTEEDGGGIYKLSYRAEGGTLIFCYAVESQVKP